MIKAKKCLLANFTTTCEPDQRFVCYGAVFFLPTDSIVGRFGYTMTGNGRWSSLMLKRKKKPGGGRRKVKAQPQQAQQPAVTSRESDGEDDETVLGEEEETAQHFERTVRPLASESNAEEEDEIPIVPLPRCEFHFGFPSL